MDDFRVEQIDHVELFVPDQQLAAEWYARVFGLRVPERYRSWARGGPLMVTSASGDTKLALFEGQPAEADARVAFRRVAFRVDGAGFLNFLARLDTLQLLKEGGAVLEPGDVVDHSLAFSIYFVDPWHHRFEITTYDHGAVRAALEKSS